MKILCPFLSGFGLSMAITSEMPDSIMWVTLYAVTIIATFGLEQLGKCDD